jgi:hypothetical protein
MKSRTGWRTALAALAGLSLACSGTRAEQREPTPDRGLPGDSTVGQGGPSTGTAPRQEPVQTLPTVSGRVIANDGTQVRLQRAGEPEVTLQVDPVITTIAVDGREGTLADLGPGTEVRASYEESRGRKHAVVLHARTGAAPGTASPHPGMEPGATMPDDEHHRGAGTGATLPSDHPHHGSGAPPMKGETTKP